MLVVSHALGEVAQVCDRCGRARRGSTRLSRLHRRALGDPGTGRERSIEAALGPIYRLLTEPRHEHAVPPGELNQLIRDTFRQACASGVCWMMLAVTAICVVLCLSVSIWGDVSLHGENEPVLFLPPPLPRSVFSAAPAVEGRASPRNRSRAGSTRGN